MPVLGPQYDTFERAPNIRQQMVEAKERTAVELAHNLLAPEETTSRPTKIAKRLGAIITGRQPRQPHRESVVAYYEPDDDASEAGQVSMAAYFSDVAGGCLFTRPIQEGSGPIEERLGPLQPRAIISNNGYFGYPVVGLDAAGNEVFPSTMSLDDREYFVNQVLETLTIISAQSYLDTSTKMSSDTLL